MPSIKEFHPIQRITDFLSRAAKEREIFKEQVWQAYEPHLVAFLEDPEAFGVKPVYYVEELKTEPVAALRRIMLRRLEDMNDNFTDRHFELEDKDIRDKCLGYGLYLSGEDIKEFIRNDTLLRGVHPLTRRRVHDEIVSNACILFNVLHGGSRGPVYACHDNTSVLWLDPWGYGFEFIACKEEKRHDGKKKKRTIQFVEPDEAMYEGGYLRLAFRNPLTHDVQK